MTGGGPGSSYARKTSGAISSPPTSTRSPRGGRKASPWHSQAGGQVRDVFTDWYVRCALWASTTDDDTPMDEVYTSEDLSPEALQAIAEDCQKFQREQAGLIA